jgi:hypothetical protein
MRTTHGPSALHGCAELRLTDTRSTCAGHQRPSLQHGYRVEGWSDGVVEPVELSTEMLYALIALILTIDESQIGWEMHLAHRSGHALFPLQRPGKPSARWRLGKREGGEDGGDGRG